MPNLYNVPLENGVQLTLQNALLTGVTTTITFTASVTSKLQASATIPGILVIDRVDANGNETPTKTEYISFTGVSGSTVTGLTRGLSGSTDQDHSAGAIVEFVPDVTWADAINDTFTVQHNADGTHKNLSGMSLASLSILTSNIDTFSFKNINAPEGFLINGKIVPSVSSNNLTVALKTLAGTDATASDPIYVRIDGTIRTITSALSLTANAGTNWLYLGGPETATYETDIFVYLSWKASTSEVLMGISRIPYGNKVGDIDQSTSIPKGSIYSAAGSATSDALVNIGRFAATLSAGAGYTWSVPTFDSANLIQRPIFETRVLFYVPTLYGATGSAGTFAANPYAGSYTINGRTLLLTIKIKCTNVGSWSSNVYVNTPMAARSGYPNETPIGGFIAANGANPATGGRATPVINEPANVISFLAGVDTGLLTWGTFVVNDHIRINGSYNI